MSIPNKNEEAIVYKVTPHDAIIPSDSTCNQVNCSFDLTVTGIGGCSDDGTGTGIGTLAPGDMQECDIDNVITVPPG